MLPKPEGTKNVQGRLLEGKSDPPYEQGSSLSAVDTYVRDAVIN